MVEKSTAFASVRLKHPAAKMMAPLSSKRMPGSQLANYADNGGSNYVNGGYGAGVAMLKGSSCSPTTKLPASILSSYNNDSAKLSSTKNNFY